MGITLGTEGLGYDNEGAIHRQELIDDYGWTITGDTEEEGNEAPPMIYDSNNFYSEWGWSK